MCFNFSRLSEILSANFDYFLLEKKKEKVVEEVFFGEIKCRFFKIQLFATFRIFFFFEEERFTTLHSMKNSL